MLASYTLAESVDNGSTDLGSGPPSTRVDPNLDRGPSDFDVRHSFASAVTYELPVPEMGRTARAILADWGVDAIVRARSAAPVDITSLRDIGLGAMALRPDLVPGVPFYIEDPLAAGGQRFNPAAFALPAEARQGTLPRNALRGFPVSQVDFVLRRAFPLPRGARAQFRVEVYNLFNQPNFADPNVTLGSALFGRSQTMWGKSAVSVGTGSLSGLYQVGGPRSMQFALKVEF
jgi:hypothetical protein